MNTPTKKNPDNKPANASVDGTKTTARLRPESLIWNDQLWNLLQSLPKDETRLKFVNITLEYFFKNAEPNLKNDPVLQVVFNLARQEIDRQINDYNGTVETANKAKINGKPAPAPSKPTPTASQPTAKTDGKQEHARLKEIADRLDRERKNSQ